MEIIHQMAEGCMPFLHFLQDIRNPVLDAIFSVVTMLGEETFFLVLAIFFFWCVNKREGYYILITGFVGTIVNQVAKIFFRVPRPWVLDPEFEIVESAREAATGYSFPSGHTQNIAGTYGSICVFKPKLWKTVLCVSIIISVAFSRMYLGVHTPLDVIVSLVIALSLVFALRPCFSTEERFKKSMPWVVLGSVILAVAYLAYILYLGGDKTLDSANYTSALKNACTLSGCTVGLIIVYFVDSKFIKFETEAKWYAQILKLVLGLAGVLVIKTFLSEPLTALFGSEYIGRAVRYFLIVVFAGGIWPMTFKWFKKM